MSCSAWVLSKLDYDSFKTDIVSGVDLNAKNSFGKSFLHYERDIRKVKLALKHGADINIQDDIEGYTPLMASIASRPSLFIFLLENGADITIKNKYCRDVFEEIIHEFDAIYEHHVCNCNLPKQHGKCRKCVWFDELHEIQDYLYNYVNKRITLFELMKPCLEESDKQRRFQ